MRCYGVLLSILFTAELISLIFALMNQLCLAISTYVIANLSHGSHASNEYSYQYVYCTRVLLYTAPDEHNFAHNFARLERLLRNHDDLEDIPKVC